MYLVGDYINPSLTTDEDFEDFNEAFNRMAARSEEVENAVICVVNPANDDDTMAIAINGELFFRAK